MDEREKNIFLKQLITKKITFKNRFVMAPVPTGFVINRIPTRENIEFYGKRAKSIGLIIAGAINVNHKTAPNHNKTPNIDSEEEIVSWKEITDEVHLNNGKIVAQIWHSGGYRKFCINGTVEVTTPSGIVNGEKVGVPMTKTDINNIVSAFSEAALNAKKAGFDGVEIHGAHGGLIHDFFCCNTNKRTDEYGISNRTLFVEEIVKACREAVGNSFPILLRISNFKMYDYYSQLASSPKEYEKFILPITNAGVDIFDCSAICFTDNAFAGYEGSLAFWTKKFADKPTINVGSVGSSKPFLNDTSKIINSISTKSDILIKSVSNKKAVLYHSESLCDSLENNDFDLIALGRPLLLDAEWVNKI